MEDRILAKAEEDLMRLTKSGIKCQGMVKRKEQEKRQASQAVSRTRERLVNQERAISLAQEGVDKARRVLECARDEGQRWRRILTKEEGEVMKCEEELDKARVDVQVYTSGNIWLTLTK